MPVLLILAVSLSCKLVDRFRSGGVLSGDYSKLYTISGYGKMVNVMILTNTQAYEANIAAFVESITLKKPEPN